MTKEQIKQNADAYANNYVVKSLYRPAYDGFVAGAHSRDEEIELLRHTLSQASNMLRNGNDKLLADYMVQKIELDQLRNPWISVEDRLPEEDKFVIFIGNNGALYLGHHYLQTDYGRTWFADGGYAMKDDEVTHWMPIPQIEKGE